VVVEGKVALVEVEKDAVYLQKQDMAKSCSDDVGISHLHFDMSRRSA
jgi:hypothetical protein